MPTYKLTYFNGRGRAEITRYLFAIAGVEYEDNRVQRDQWADLKKTMPFGQLPVLEVDGIKIAQGLAIARFVATRLGLAGKDDIQHALADSYVLAADEIFAAMMKTFFEKDEERKTQMKNKFKEETLPDKLSKFEAILSANASGYFVGDQLTWADVMIFDMLDWLRRRTLSDEELSAYPKIVALESKVKALPNIVAWIAKRPESEF